MVKNFKSILVLVLALLCTLTLVGCGFGSKAQKLDEEFKAGEKYSLADIKDKMGDPTSEALILNSGVVLWIDGCKTMDEAKAKWDEGEKLEMLVVTVVANNVTSVDYVPEATEDDAK